MIGMKNTFQRCFNGEEYRKSESRDEVRFLVQYGKRRRTSFGIRRRKWSLETRDERDGVEEEIFTSESNNFKTERKVDS